MTSMDANHVCSNYCCEFHSGAYFHRRQKVGCHPERRDGSEHQEPRQSPSVLCAEEMSLAQHPLIRRFQAVKQAIAYIDTPHNQA
jgi:hypothetical protein